MHKYVRVNMDQHYYLYNFFNHTAESVISMWNSIKDNKAIMGEHPQLKSTILSAKNLYQSFPHNRVSIEKVEALHLVYLESLKDLKPEQPKPDPWEFENLLLLQGNQHMKYLQIKFKDSSFENAANQRSIIEGILNHDQSGKISPTMSGCSYDDNGLPRTIFRGSRSTYDKNNNTIASHFFVESSKNDSVSSNAVGATTLPLPTEDKPIGDIGEYVDTDGRVVKFVLVDITYQGVPDEVREAIENYDVDKVPAELLKPILTDDFIAMVVRELEES